MAYYVDLDGTVADSSHREQYLKDQNVPTNVRWSNFFHPSRVRKDAVLPKSEVLNQLLAGEKPVTFLTSRPESLRQASGDWLSQNFSNYNPENHRLLMKPNGELSPSPAWKAQQIADRGDEDFTFIDDSESNRAAMAERFPGATVYAPEEAWDTLTSELGSQAPTPTGEPAPTADEPIQTTQEETSAEDYSDMDLTGGS